MKPTISLVIPCFNEADGLPVLFDRLESATQALMADFEWVFVNDGSSDATLEILKARAAQDRRVRIIDLSRNFGKELALTAGLDHARGDAVIPLDADLQDPPELIASMIERWQSGFDVVLAIRSSRAEDHPVKRMTANGFYRLFGRLSDVEMKPNAGDFRLMDQRVVEALRQLPERTRFMKGLFAWLGFKQTEIYFSREKRAVGNSKWGSWKLWNFALDGIFSFSTAPLRIWSYLGAALSVFSCVYLIFVVLDTLIHGNPVPGYPSLVAIMLFFNGVILLGLGIVGEYIGRIFIETKRRPLYLVRETVGFNDD